MLPWDWLNGAADLVAGVSQAVYNWVASIISSMYNWVADGIKSIWSTIMTIGSELTQIWNSVVNTVESIVSNVQSWIATAIRDVTSWVSRGISDLWGWIHGAWDWTVNQVTRLEHLISNVFSDIVDWVKRDVIDPLTRGLEDIKNFFLGLFNQIWQYIQHPELLISLLGGFLLKMWVQYVVRFGATIARFILRNMMGLAGEVFDLLEHILTSII